jgi:hypothetical protein
MEVDVTRRTRKRMAIAMIVGSAAVALSLMVTVGASAHDGHGNDSATGTVAASSHGGDRATAGRDDGHNGQGDDDNGQGRPLLSAMLAPSMPTDPAIHGVAAGGLPWVLDRGRVRLKADGSIRVEIKGLVIPIAHGTFPAGTALPVATVSASLYCAPDSAAAAATTTTVPISASGNATIVDTIALPPTCLAPIVLIHPNGGATAYIAASGWRS